jgi:hypothetical protein
MNNSLVNLIIRRLALVPDGGIPAALDRMIETYRRVLRSERPGLPQRDIESNAKGLRDAVIQRLEDVAKKGRG